MQKYIFYVFWDARKRKAESFKRIYNDRTPDAVLIEEAESYCDRDGFELIGLYKVTIDAKKLAGRERLTRECQKAVHDSVVACFGARNKPTNITFFIEDAIGLWANERREL